MIHGGRTRFQTLILPVAGVGKRLQPLTRHTPKNLIKVNGTPLLGYALEEAAAIGGFTTIVLVVSPRHRGHFRKYLRGAKRRFPRATFVIRVQDTPKGNGHAVALAADVVGRAPFVVRFCDDILIGTPPVLGRLVRIATARRASVVLLERVPQRLVPRFGVVGVRNRRGVHLRKEKGRLYELTRIVEKPPLKEAPSNLTIVGGYALMPTVMRDVKLVADSLPGNAGSDALPLMVGLQIELITGKKMYGWEFDGERLDCGTIEALAIAEQRLRTHT